MNTRVPMHRRLVVKLGTSVLTGGTPHLAKAHLVDLVRQCAAARAQGAEVIVCTSGAIAAGRSHLGVPHLTPSLAERQMLAAVGQGQLMHVWSQLFGLYDLHVGQLLLTRADVEDRSRYLNARDALRALLDHGVVPIVNENDAVATTEIKVGDNDNLSALVTVLAEADLLLLLTDQPGLFTADPRTDPDAQLIPEVHTIDASIRALAGGPTSGLGTGGMATKLQAADTARRAGADVIIAAGRAPDVILRALEGTAVGTAFPATGSSLDHRKRWILAGPAPTGTLHLDVGAVRALRDAGRSLLPVGVTATEGAFARGDSVVLRTPDGIDLGRGLVRYDHQALRQILGLQSDAIADRLGYTQGPSVIHRDELVLHAPTA
ncbi:MAG: glutamate 5-kinase [Bacteroidota bacterium]